MYTRSMHLVERAFLSSQCFTNPLACSLIWIQKLKLKHSPRLLRKCPSQKTKTLPTYDYKGSWGQDNHIFKKQNEKLQKQGQMAFGSF